MKVGKRLWLVACSGLVLTACAFTGSPATPVPHTADGVPPANLAARLIDADAFGAIVVGGDPATMWGVDRSGRVVWTDQHAGTTLAHAVCVRHCPDALISSNLDSLRSPTSPDGPARAVTEGSAQTLRSPLSTKHRVLAADGASQVVATGNEHGWFVDIVNDNAVTSRTPVGGWPTVWQATSDNSRALAITAKSGSPATEVRRFVRTTSGWTLDGPVLSSDTEFACASAKTDRVIISASSPMLRGEDVSRRLPDLDAGSECSFAASGAIIAQNAMRDGSVASRVVTIDNDGNELTTRDMGGDVRVRADANGDRVAILNVNAVTVQTIAGHVLARYPDVADARFDGAGNLVVVSHAGAVQWIPRIQT